MPVSSNGGIYPGTMRPNPNEMTDFNVFSLNARIFPGTEPMVAKLGERVRIRFVNLSAMDHHPMHLHGHSFPRCRKRRMALPNPRSKSKRRSSFRWEALGNWEFILKSTWQLAQFIAIDAPSHGR